MLINSNYIQMGFNIDETSFKNFNKSLTKSENAFLKKLRRGKENALKSTYLSSILKVDKRQIAALACNLRLKGVEVASTRQEPMGYYLCKDYAELIEYINYLDRQIKLHAKTINALKRSNLARLAIVDD